MSPVFANLVMLFLVSRSYGSGACNPYSLFNLIKFRQLGHSLLGELAGLQKRMPMPMRRSLRPPEEKLMPPLKLSRAPS